MIEHIPTHISSFFQENRAYLIMLPVGMSGFVNRYVEGA